MSKPLPPRPVAPPTPNATKQLLDELDALMERMLALPVNDLGDALEPEAGAATDRSPTPSDKAARPAAHATAECPPVEEVSGDMVRPATDVTPESLGGLRINRHTGSPSLPAPHWKPEQMQEAERFLSADPPAAFGPHPAFAPIATVPLSTPPDTTPGSLPVTPSPRPRILPRPWPTYASPSLGALWDRWLVWTNRTFDRYTCWLGKPGRWLQGPTGRTVLGWLGLGLLAAAGAWTLSIWFDWTW
jgi:hypothetical protein